MTTAPDLADVLGARARIGPYLRPTPLYRYPALDVMTGAQLRVKHENHQPVGAFKVRGGVNLVSQLSAETVIAASTGNHGQSVAYAADLVEDTTSTFAEGLATRTAFELPQQIMRALLDDFVLVSEDALKAATRLVAIICSGGNISPAQLAELWPH
jgi:threonine dehydratase